MKNKDLPRLLLRLAFLAALLVLLALPVIYMNKEKGAVSVIDNKVLADNPLEAESIDYASLPSDLEGYLGDRIGFRKEMIRAYTWANDALFAEMVYPSYMYGKNKEIFMRGDFSFPYGDYYEDLADALLQMKLICDRTQTPFLFVIEPIKTSVMAELLPDGYAYSRAWVDRFMNALRERGIECIDNYEVLRERYLAGERVYNAKYDPVHWNDTGAFCAVNHILSYLQQYFPALRVNTREDFEISEKTYKEQLNATFSVADSETVFALPDSVVITENILDGAVYGGAYGSYRLVDDYINESRLAEGAPRVLVFQNSYLGQKGEKFLQNALGEYRAVQLYLMYENLFRFEYYYSTFLPDCVIVDLSEHAINAGTIAPEWIVSYLKMKKVGSRMAADP